jgi:DNA polymerase-3 subunit epsilon
MSLLDLFRFRAPTLSADQAVRLAALGPPAVLGDTPLEAQSWVVVDVETTGLNLQKDSVVAIGAVSLDGPIIPLGAGFECTLAIKANLAAPSTLIHGLSPAVLARGLPPAEALLRFLEYVDGRPLLAFHASFDQGMLVRAIKHTLGLQWQAPFMDLAEVAPLLCPNWAAHNHSLDDWIKQFGLHIGERHHASADALVTAELGLMLFSLARRQGLATPAALLDALSRWRRRRDQPSL